MLNLMRPFIGNIKVVGIGLANYVLQICVLLKDNIIASKAFTHNQDEKNEQQNNRDDNFCLSELLSIMKDL
jgi:hypothetical protein